MLTQADYNELYYTAGGPGGGYDNYSENSASSETAVQCAAAMIAKLAANGISIAGKKVLDIGCGYGFLGKYLLAQGVDVYGMDWSAWAVANVVPEMQGRVIQGSSIDPAAWTAVRALAGLSGGGGPKGKFDVIIDQDMIVCLTDAQATQFLTLAKANSNFLIHYLESYNPHIVAWYNYKTLAEWKAFAGNDPKEKWYSRFYWLET